MGRGPKPAKGKAKPAVARKSPKRDGAKLHDLEKRLAEALKQQTATGEILRVIADSPADLQAVLNAVAERAARLCSANDSMIFQVDGDALRPVVRWGSVPTVLDADTRIPISRAALTGRALVDRTAVHIHDITTRFDEFSVSQRYMGRTGIRTVLAMPLLRHNTAIGAIQIRRLEIQPFTDEQIELLKTFADQAVIAIENVRLFTELQEKNQAFTKAHAQVSEALEQQTATAEILRVISSSPTDVQPVFDAIAQSAVRLCHGDFCTVARYDGELLHLVGHAQASPEGVDALRRMFPMRPTRATFFGRTTLERGVVHIPDVRVDAELARPLTQALHSGSGVGVPMLREGQVIGVIGIGRYEVQAFTDQEIALLQTFADQAVIAIENARLFNETKEALEQQTATSEILRVISSSPTDLQPVFDTISRSAARVCEAFDATVVLADGDEFVRRAHYGPIEAVLGARYPLRGTVAGQSILEARVIHVEDLLQASGYSAARAEAQRVGYRTVLIVPLLRDGAAIGAIGIRRTEVLPFSDKQIALLQTFADQAVIAIENVRLFTELQERNLDLRESLDRQTATADVLRIIAESPTDLQPVLEAIAASAVRLCAASDAVIERLEGDRFYNAAHSGAQMKGLVGLPLPLTRRFPGGRAVLDRAPVIIDDIHLIAEREYPDTLELLKLNTIHSVAEIPLLSEGKALGSIAVLRAEVRPFTEAEVALLQTFADQAVIAIENVRLFKELQTSNHELTAALDKQTATSEILRVISQSPTDVQPVFDTIVQSAARLCHAANAGVFLTDGRTLDLPANYGSSSPEVLATIRAQYPRPLDRETTAGVAILTRSVVHVPDIEGPTAAEAYTRRVGQLLGVRSMVAVPMMRKGEVVGAINLSRPEPGQFSDMEVELLKTFADQAVIAIENVRLFNETKQSLEQQTATASILQVISSSPTDIQPVFDAIARNAVRLCGALRCHVFRFDGTLVHIAADYNLQPEAEGYFRHAFPSPLTSDGVLSAAIRERRVVQHDNAQTNPTVPAKLREIARRLGYQAIMAVPMLHDDTVIGAIGVSRLEPHPFSEQQIELLKTFADQAVIAIENVRLFKELEVANRELAAASQHKSEFLANMSHELRTPLNAVIGFSEVLADRMFGELNAKQEEYLKDIYASGTHLLSLINDILDLSKIEAGRMELELTDFDLPTALDNALTLVRERAGRRSITLQTSIDERLGEVRADERKIRQVVLNLLSNAIKFTPEGGRIDVGAVPKDGFVEVSVSDTGVGIAPEDQEAVFEEFRQVGTAEKKVEGTGLGLTLCRKFVELHGGRIWVKSQEGVGSTFTFTIPVRHGE